MTETFYDVLGVAEDATTDEIEAAYRERLKDTHPDVNDDEDASRETRTLIEARDVLVDEDERARYDRVGHDAYVGADPAPSADAAADAADRTDSAEGSPRDGGTTSESTADRGRRERRASQRVSEERRRAREARQERRQATEESDTEATSSDRTDDDAPTDRRRASTVGADESASKRRAHTAEVDESSGRRQARTAEAATGESSYSVREDVATPTSHGSLLPSGRELTLLGIFFALYPFLLFTAVLPAFPLFVNLFLGACTLVMISYVQSMPRVALLLFGGWSVISILGLGLFGIGYLSLVGIVVLCGTVLPFGFSVLTASALRY